MENTVGLPDSFIFLIKESLPEEISKKLISALSSDSADVVLSPYVSVRFNEAKIKDIEILPDYLSGNIQKKIPWCNNSWYLKSRPSFSADPLFNSGAYYVQDASSMYMELVWKAIFNSCSIDNPIRLLDLCAAPGGKSTLLSSLLQRSCVGDGYNKDYLLVANEVIGSRAAVLAENMAKWGDINTIVTNNDPSHFSKLKNYFDFIVVDAPCSGEGMFRKNSGAIGEWSLQNVKLCSGRQKRILSDIWPSLKPGGILVYSTCTFNHLENDDNLNFIAENLGGDIITLNREIYEEIGLIETKGRGYQFLPGVSEGEGQYFAIIRKSGQYYYNKRKEKYKSELKEEHRAEYVKLYPSILDKEIELIKKHLRILSSGTIVASIKGKDIIPYSDLALSIYRDKIEDYLRLKYKFSYNTLNVSLEQARKFLSKETLILDNVPKGYLLLQYNGIGLGFVKNLGNRINNLLPNVRRIKPSLILFSFLVGPVCFSMFL